MNDSTSPKTAKRFTVPGSRTVWIFLVALLVAPMIYSVVRSEVAQWLVAAGYEHILRDDNEAALQLLDRAIRWDPRNEQLYMLRADWKIAHGDAAGALSDCDRVVTRARTVNDRQRSRQSKALLASALNSRAYAYALHGSDLEDALDDINEALSINQNYLLEHAFLNAAMLDTRGYIYLLLGRLDEAQADLEEAVRSSEDNYKFLRDEYRRIQRHAIDKRPATYMLQQLTQHLAVVYHHRGELYQLLGREEESRRDLRRAIRLGYDPARGG